MTTTYAIVKYNKNELKLKEARLKKPPRAQNNPPKLNAKIGPTTVNRINCGKAIAIAIKKAKNKIGILYNSFVGEDSIFIILLCTF